MFQESIPALLNYIAFTGVPIISLSCIIVYRFINDDYRNEHLVKTQEECRFGAHITHAAVLAVFSIFILGTFLALDTDIDPVLYKGTFYWSATTFTLLILTHGILYNLHTRYIGRPSGFTEDQIMNLWKARRQTECTHNAN